MYMRMLRVVAQDGPSKKKATAAGAAVALEKKRTKIIAANWWSDLKMRGKPFSGKAIFVFCLASFLAGSLFTSRTFWTQHQPHHDHDHALSLPQPHHVTRPRDCDHKRVRLFL